jgi:thymidylate kinase
MEAYLLLQRNRDFIIKKLFFLIKKKYDYAILHHLSTVFDKETDIDLVIGCNKSDFIILMKNIANELELKIVNFFTIDKNIYRLDFMFLDDGNAYDTIELDCLLFGNGENLYKINAAYLLKDHRSQEFENHLFDIVEQYKEYEYYIKKKAYKDCDIKVHYKYLQELQPNKSQGDIDNLYKKWRKYFTNNSYKIKYFFNKFSLFYLRIFDKPSISISILGPDGSGKSTIINKLFKYNIFRNKYYFHLKPLKQKQANNQVCEEPHKYKPYGTFKSYVKIFYYVFLYSFGWLINIMPLEFKSSLVVFDRYYDDILADPKRYRYGADIAVVKFIRVFIPQPEIYFILTTDAKTIQNRKEEVPYDELERQLVEYTKLVDGKKYFSLDASKSPDEIIREILKIIGEKMHDKY